MANEQGVRADLARVFAALEAAIRGLDEAWCAVQDLAPGADVAPAVWGSVLGDLLARAHRAHELIAAGPGPSEGYCAPAWTFESYWSFVLGDQAPADVVAEFGEGWDEEGIPEVLCVTERAAWDNTGHTGEVPGEWAQLRAIALGKIVKVIDTNIGV